MRSRKFIVFLAIFLALGLVCTYAQTVKMWRQTGVNTFVRIRGQVPTAEVMKTLADKYAGDIKMGFDLAGRGDLYLPFLESLKAASFSDASLAVGEKFDWMLFRVGGKVKTWPNVQWAGKAPLEVFTFDVATPDMIYTFAIPKPCGNIALYKTTPVKKPAPAAVCSLVVSPAKVNLNEPVTVDMSGTQNAVSKEVEVFNAQGLKVASQVISADSGKWQMRFDQPGDYVFKSKAVNADGVPSTNPCEAKVYVNAPPVCKLWTSCLPCEDYVGRPITFDANGSTDADGQVVKTVFELTDAAGNVVDSATVSQKPFAWEKIISKPGTYTINAVVFDDMGAASLPTDPCKISFEVTQKRFFFVAEAGGLLARGTYTGYLFGRLGMLWSLVPDTLDLIVTAGPAFSTQGQPWKTIFMANAVASVHLGPAVYVGAGLGYSTKEQDVRKGGVDFVGQFGVNVFNRWTSAGSVFAEARIPVLTSDRPVENHYKLLLGFRYIF